MPEEKKGQPQCHQHKGNPSEAVHSLILQTGCENRHFGYFISSSKSCCFWELMTILDVILKICSCSMGSVEKCNVNNTLRYRAPESMNNWNSWAVQKFQDICPNVWSLEATYRIYYSAQPSMLLQPGHMGTHPCLQPRHRTCQEHWTENTGCSSSQGWQDFSSSSLQTPRSKFYNKINFFYKHRKDKCSCYALLATESTAVTNSSTRPFWLLR